MGPYRGFAPQDRLEGERHKNEFTRRMVRHSTEKYVEGLDRAIDENREANGKKCFQCLEPILWNLKIFIG